MNNGRIDWRKTRRPKIPMKKTYREGERKTEPREWKEITDARIKKQRWTDSWKKKEKGWRGWNKKRQWEKINKGIQE